MINYWEKNLTFHVYDHPFKNDNLLNYSVRGIKIIHADQMISIKFCKENSILAIGIFVIKIKQISVQNIFDLSFFLCENDECVEITPNGEDLETVIQNSRNKEFNLLVISDNYNLTKEANIVVYFNLNNEYEDTSLEEIFAQINISR